MADTRPIGIFDSGIGGLTVLASIRELLPHEDVVYFADAAHMPYGDKTPAQIIDFARHTLSWMVNDIGVKMVIFACHTSSAIALDRVASEYSIPMIGTMLPTAQAVLADPSCKNLGVIATPTSVASKRHEHALRGVGFAGDIHLIACPEFVPLIEAGERGGAYLEAVTRLYLAPFHQLQLDTLIYGCTHYPLIAETIVGLLPVSTRCIDPAKHIAVEAKEQLANFDLLSPNAESATTIFYRSETEGKPIMVASLL